MSVSVELIACHRGEPAWSAIDRVCGRGTADGLDEDDPAVQEPLRDDDPVGWQEDFVEQLRGLGEWEIDEGTDGIFLSSLRWRWSVFVRAGGVTLTYRRTGPAGPDDLDDRFVLEIAARLGMVAYWPDLQTWVDLRQEPVPDSLG